MSGPITLVLADGSSVEGTDEGGWAVWAPPPHGGGITAQRAFVRRNPGGRWVAIEPASDRETDGTTAQEALETLSARDGSPSAWATEAGRCIDEHAEGEQR
jgi:hypothetical protein